MSGPVPHLRLDPREVADQLVFSLGWSAGRVPVFVDGGARPAFRAKDGLELWERASRLDLEESAEVTCGLPTRRGSVGESTVLWAWVTSPGSLRRAVRFRPAPSIVLRFGGSAQRLLLWALSEAVAWPLVGPHVERVAYALHAPRNRAVPERLRVPVPGTFLRVGRARAVPVLVTRLETSSFSLGDVTGRLKDAPSRDAWRHR